MDEQRDLVEAAEAFLANRSSSSAVREFAESDAADTVGWGEMAELGWTGIVVAEEHGGAGLGFVELGLLLEEMGRALLPGPFLSSAAIGADAIQRLGSAEQRERWLPGLAAGELRATLAVIDSGEPATVAGGRLTGAKTGVLDGAGADLLLVVAEPGPTLFLVEAGAADAAPQAPFDLTRRLADVRFDSAPAEPLGDAPGCERALARAAAAIASEQAGTAARCLEMAVEYARDRVQFGRPIGSFQALKHRCADIELANRAARSAARHACRLPDLGSPDLVPAAAIAASTGGTAAVGAARANLQVHAGIGFSWEHDTHLLLRRAESSRLLLGDAAPGRGAVLASAGV